MNEPLDVERILGDRPFAEVSESVLTVTAGGLVAMAGEFDHETRRAPVAVYDGGDQRRRAVLRSRHPVQALAFHPTAPLLAVGTGEYDGGYFFEGELLLLDLETGAVVSLIEEGPGRQVLGLEWLNNNELRLLLAPPDDWEDRAARVEGHEAVVRRDDWRSMPPESIEYQELAGPRVPAPRQELLALDRPRRNVRAVEELPDGRVLAALSGVAVEAWLPSGELQWRVPDDDGGAELVVTPDGASVWSRLRRHTWPESVQSVSRHSLEDGARLDEFAPPAPCTLVRSDGRPVIAFDAALSERARLRITRGRAVYLHEIEPTPPDEIESPAQWLTAAEVAPPEIDGHPHRAGSLRRLFPYAWVPDEWHHGGPGTETADGSLVYAGTVHHGHGLQPGGVFVVRRDMTSGTPRWVFRTDHPAVALDADDHTAFVAFDDGEIVAFDLADGSVQWRCHLPGTYPTALTVPAVGRLLVGTSDGRILDCVVTVGRPRHTPPR
ncbi:hypothetical protein [Actinoplanes sp. CA-252034]|uniref:hypothetical protein n=1 Tax=Actinoplanes sp. CA-252034 TaxID=3239906 RepID=UPI003D97AC92